MATIYDNVGDYLTAAVAVVPADRVAGAVNGAGIDRAAPNGRKYESAHFVIETGAVTGAPTDASIDLVLQDSADNSVFANFIPLPGPALTATIVDVNNDTTPGSKIIGSRTVNLKGARRYVRVVSTLAFVGGTTPSVVYGVIADLGGADRLP